MKSSTRRTSKMMVGYLFLALFLSSTFVACGASSSTNPVQDKKIVTTPIPLISEKHAVTTPKTTQPATTPAPLPPTPPPEEPPAVSTPAPVVSPSPAPAPAEPVGKIVYITKTGEKYHEDGCRFLSKSKIEITLDKAKDSGFDPCSVCKPPQ